MMMIKRNIIQQPEFNKKNPTYIQYYLHINEEYQKDDAITTIKMTINKTTKNHYL